MPASSLFVDWTSSSHTYEATSVLEHLIKVLAADVCSFRRNTLSSYQLVDTIRTLINKINGLIKDVEEKGNWEDFLKYTDAIDPLEEILLDFGLQDEINEDVDLLDSSSVEKFLSFIKRWELNRTTIRDRIKILRAEKNLSKLLDEATEDQDNLDAAYKHDDRTLLRDLVAGIKTHLTREKIAPEFPKQMFTLLDEVSRGADDIERLLRDTASLPADWDALAIKSMMAVYGLVMLGVNGDIDLPTRRHLKLRQPWMVAKNLLAALIGYSNQNKDKKHVETLYNSFLEEFSVRSEGDLPASYIELLKMVARIGRAYHAQSLLLVTMCRELAQCYLGQEPRNEKHYLSLQNVFDQTLTALQNSIEAMKPSAGQEGRSKLSHLDINKYGQQPCVEQFKLSAKDLASCFDELGLAQAKKSPERLQLAFEQDKARMEKINLKVAKVQAGADDANSAEVTVVEVTVKVQKSSSPGKKFEEHIVHVPSTARLTAIGWVISRKPDVKAEITTPDFKFEYKGADSQLVSKPADTDVQSLATNNKLALTMMI